MRTAFIQTLIELARADERVLLLTADLGYTVVEPFTEEFPKRFINVGVAEQNMVGIATGLAQAGFIPFLYSISNFASLRPYEFIRNGPILHHVPVRIIGIGGGFDYGSAGITHYGLEDLGIMRIQKGITTVVPFDMQQTRSALLATWDWPGPVYYRISKGDKSSLGTTHDQFHPGKIQTLTDGKDLLFVCIGTITKEVLKATQILSEQGIFATVIAVSSFNPSPEGELGKALKKFPLAITVEEHYINGGLGSFVCEIVAENQIPCRIIRCAVEGRVGDVTGSRAFMLDHYGLSPQKLVAKAKASLKSLSHEKSADFYNTSHT